MHTVAGGYEAYLQRYLLLIYRFSFALLLLSLFRCLASRLHCGGIYARVYCTLYYVYDVAVKIVHVRCLIS